MPVLLRGIEVDEINCSDIQEADFAEMRFLRCINIDQRPLAAADIEPHTAAGRQTIPGKDAEIIVEDRLTLLVREMIRVLPEVRPFAPEAAYDQRIPVIAGSILN